MIIIPAIDIKNGKVVRLLQGKFDEVTEYSNSPLWVAQNWKNQGAQYLHLVDLDGAKEGMMKNLSVVKQIIQETELPVQVGGGIRGNFDVIEELVTVGVARVVLGTSAIEHKDFLQKCIDRFGEKIAVSLDCSNGMVATKGWTNVTDIKGTELALELQEMGLSVLIYTDIARDGMLTGPNLIALEDMLDTVSIPVIASGGVSYIEDVQQLMKLKDKGLLGVITGKAIYEGTLDLKEAISLCSTNA